MPTQKIKLNISIQWKRPKIQGGQFNEFGLRPGIGLVKKFEQQ